MNKRRWLYAVKDFDGNEIYVDRRGNPVSRDAAQEHIATDEEAQVESVRRADLWERKKNDFVASISRHSQGIFKEEPDSDTQFTPFRE